MAEEGITELHRFCPICGEKAVPGASFCGKCGHSLATGSASEVQPESIRDAPNSSAFEQTGRDDFGTDAPSPAPATARQSSAPSSLVRRKSWILLAIVVIVVIAGAVLAVSLSSSSNSGETTSYKDGRLYAESNSNQFETEAEDLCGNWMQQQQISSIFNSWSVGCVSGLTGGSSSSPADCPADCGSYDASYSKGYSYAQSQKESSSYSNAVNAWCSQQAASAPSDDDVGEWESGCAAGISG